MRVQSSEYQGKFIICIIHIILKTLQRILRSEPYNERDNILGLCENMVFWATSPQNQSWITRFFLYKKPFYKKLVQEMPKF